NNHNTLYQTANHELLSSRAGFQVLTYRYYDNVRHLLDMNGMLTDIRQAAPGSVILFHTCAHNPTGMDPTRDQWSQIADIMVERRLFPFFDCAYQGFASGDPDRDTYSVRLFVDRGLELVCAQSFSKNFGLYVVTIFILRKNHLGERVGNLTIVLNNPKPIKNICSQMLMIVRGNYSGPPAHGARIVTKILNDPQLYEEKCCVQIMATRMRQMRSQLREHLERLGTPGEWSHITRQIGMFSYTGLTDRQVTHLSDSYHIYMLSNGRLSMCGLTTKNVEYVAKAIRDALTISLFSIRIVNCHYVSRVGSTAAVPTAPPDVHAVQEFSQLCADIKAQLETCGAIDTKKRKIVEKLLECENVVNTNANRLDEQKRDLLLLSIS
ncbi:unnamed protein product, partial [Medioppia subpectinata]